MIPGYEIFTIATNIATIASPIVAVVALIVALYISYRESLPIIIIYLDYDSDHNAMYLRIKNIGKGVARNINLIGKDILDITDEKNREYASKSFLINGIDILVPGAERSLITATGRIEDNMGDVDVNVILKYEYRSFLMPRNKQYRERYPINYQSFFGQLSITSDLHEIKNALKEIASKV